MRDRSSGCKALAFEALSAIKPNALPRTIVHGRGPYPRWPAEGIETQLKKQCRNTAVPSILMPPAFVVLSSSLRQSGAPLGTMRSIGVPHRAIILKAAPSIVSSVALTQCDRRECCKHEHENQRSLFQ